MNFFNKIGNKLSRRNSISYVKYLRKNGCSIGNYVHFHDPKNTFVDPNVLSFINIGNNVSITRGVTILAHDYSYKVFRKKYHDMPQKFGITKIGNNVFIGMNAIILMGSRIGDNCVIGAGAVVSGNIPDNSVVAGNPAKVICTIDEYHDKCIKEFKNNAIQYTKSFIEVHNRIPTIEEMGFYSVIFLDKNNQNKKYFEKLNITGDNKADVIFDLMNIKNEYKNYNEFINSITNK